ncbi:DBR1-domain-containing protein [Aspergillus californicus]
MSDMTNASIRIAVEGCGHGRLHDIYASVERASTLKGWDGVDLLIIGGDFQSIRNSNDMACMSVPQQYKEIGDFHEYYSGLRTAPYLTVFIGGNHEASNYLYELYHGGWVAPNIYYMGAANVLRCGPLRIAALSRIWKGYDYNKPHFERIPYNRDDLSSIYHIRELDVRKLLQIRTQVDVGLSHDWPRQVEYSGDWQHLFQIKPHFYQDSLDGTLGSQAGRYVLDRLRPAYWFSAHMHCKFVAAIQHLPRGYETRHNFGLDGASLASMLAEEEDEENQQARPVYVAPQSVAPRKEGNESKFEQAEPLLQPNNENIPVVTAQQPEATSIESHKNKPQNPVQAWNNFHAVAAEDEAAENSRFLDEQEKRQDDPPVDIQHNLTWRKVSIDDDEGRKLTGVEKSGDHGSRDTKKQKIQHELEAVKNTDEIDLNLDSDSDQEQETIVQTSIARVTEEKTASNASTVPQTSISQTMPSDVSEDLRSQLPSSFAAPQVIPRVVPQNAPFPEAIGNTTTNFLALDKCLGRRKFLQLLEIPVISDTEGAQLERPFRLQYDKEWLAITRVFANDLHLNDPSFETPPDKGSAVYLPLIEEEEKWVDEHVVKPGKLAVPENFTPTAPVYDPAIPVTTDQQPLEVNNPQTAAFCELIGIENKFYLTEEQRDARMAAGPRPSANPRGRGGYGFRGRGSRGGRDGRGGRGHGHGRGRGREFGRNFSRGGRGGRG